MKTLTRNMLGGREGMISLGLLCIVLFLVLPGSLDIFRLNMMAKYLSYAFVAVGLVLCWGYGGILSLGQGLFWGLGGYCMAAFLKLEAAHDVAMEKGSDTVRALTTVGLPDFMDWNQITSLPWFWYPFKSFWLTLVLVFIVPTVLAYVIGIAMFKRRVAGVYFSIITQALCWLMEILFVTRQGWTGGINGITDLRTCLGWDIRTPHAQRVLYFLTCIGVILCIVAGRLILSSKLGRLLIALRDEEDRVRFSGYSVSAFKTFIFCVAAAMSALGGALFVFNVGFMSPKLVTIEPSIYMVIFCAVGGRNSLVGAVYGTLIVMFGQSYFSDAFPALWYFCMGSVFILVTRFFPMGLAGLAESGVGLLKRVFDTKSTSATPSVPPMPALTAEVAAVPVETRSN
jgi:urea transport system permease protein